MNRTARCAAAFRPVKFRTVGWASIPLLLISIVLLIGCQPKAPSKKDLPELSQAPEVLITSNLEVWDILGRPTSVGISLELQTQWDSNVLKVAARAEPTFCASRIALPNDASEEEIYKYFAEKTESFKCFSAPFADIEADVLREVVRIFYLTLFPTVSNAQHKELPNHGSNGTPNKTMASYDFDKLAKTPIYYSWQTSDDGCTKQSAIKIRGLKEISGVWTPRSADVIVGFHCGAPAARFFIDVQDTSVSHEQFQSQSQTDDN